MCLCMSGREKRLAHRELNSLLIQSSAFRTSPAHTTKHNTSGILWSCVRVLMHASKQSALPVTQTPGSENRASIVFTHVRAALQHQSPKQRKVFKSISFSAKSVSFGLSHLWFCSGNNLLIALMLPSVEELGDFTHHCSGFFINMHFGVQLDSIQISTKVKVRKTARGR